MLAVCVAFGTFPLNALGGDGYSSRIPFKISDPKNVTDKDTVFTVKLSSVGKAPMPEVASINAKANEEYMFGPIEFEEPGDYSYTISQVAVNDDRIILDETIYEVDVAVFVEADGSMWGSTAVSMEGSGSKEEIPVFENDYGKITPPDDSSGPQNSSEDDSSDTSDSSDGDSSRTDDSDSSDTSDGSSGDSSDDSSGDSQNKDSSSSKADSGGYVDTSSSEADVIPPADDSSDAESSDTDISGGVGTSSGRDSSGTKTEESSKGGGGVGTLIDTLTSPDTGGKVAVTFSGLMIAGAVVAVASGRRRSRRNSDNDDDDGGGSG